MTNANTDAEFDDSAVPALDDAAAQQLRDVDDEFANARAESLRAGLADYELDEDDLDLLEVVAS